MSTPLTHEQVTALLQRSKAGDAEATEILVKNNVALVKSVTRKFMGRGVEFDDLFQVGCVGLVKAIHNFNTEFGVRFSTYAVPMIAGELRRYLRDDGAIKVSRSLKELAARAAAAEEKLKYAQGREPTIDELARELGESAEDIVFAKEAARACVSLHEHRYDDDGALLIDSVPDPHKEDDVIDRMLLRELLTSLDPRERQIIFLRYFKDETQSEIAKKLGVSQVQVSRLESRILKKMREKVI